jgi:superfamily II DNA or RNA helicase
MPVVLRDYQAAGDDAIESAWQRVRNVLAVYPTGSGKTVLFAHKLATCRGPSVAVAHRQELVSQISLALARNEVRHRIIAPTAVRAGIEALHMIELGRRWVDQNASCGVAGVDTLIRASGAHFDAWRNSVQLWVMDEAHHVLRDNKWGKGCALFPAARGLGVTATPTRADGRGLGRQADGLMDEMIVGPSMRDLIGQNYLTDYRIFAPKSDLDLSQVATGGSGEFVATQLRAAVHQSHITGDVVAHYLRLAPGKLGVTFAVDIEAATEIAQAFRSRGVAAEVVTSKTPDAQRVAILRRFRAREVLQLVNVDLFGEGFDLPAIEVVSMARPTQSYARYCQQFGRALRLLEGKSTAIIIDHVGNVFRHGLPDARREWTLDRREACSRVAASDVMPTTSCTQCASVYERFYSACPYCGHKNEPASRSSPAHVDGDLQELDPAVLAAMRGEVARIDDAPIIPYGLRGTPAGGAVVKHHNLRSFAQRELRAHMALYGGWRHALGEDLSMSHRRFFHTFGVDVMSAQALNASGASELRERIERLLTAASVSPILPDGIKDPQRWHGS